MKKTLALAALLLATTLLAGARERINLDSKPFHNGKMEWKMAKIADVSAPGEKVSSLSFDDASWMEAIVPGTVLNTLVYNKVYPEPYYGLNNKIESGIIPDISEVGRDFYTAWFRTTFKVPAEYEGKNIWMQLDGVNYRSEVWVNGHLLATTGGMFKQETVDLTKWVKAGETAVLAVKVLPVDTPGTKMLKPWGAVGEWHNGGDGDIGLNTTMLMSVGWDFTFMDGIRDRSTGIWKSIWLYSTGKARLRDPFIRCELSKPGYDVARQTVSVTVVNPSRTMDPVDITVRGEIVGEGISFEKTISAYRGAQLEVTFTPDEYKQLVMKNPRLWWPVNKGPQNLYDLKLTALVDGEVCDEIGTRFGIREIVSDCNTPDGSRCFYVNGKRIFIRGSNWIPEAMLRMSDKRTETELRFTRQCGINLLRFWGGGIFERERFYELCDELGILIWQEFWMSGDCNHAQDQDLYLANVKSVVKQIRNHPALAYYVASNESTEVTGMKELILSLDGTRGYQMQSECDGVHDGSPYKQVNPMRHYENTASDRGSRVDGFNPEYGAPCLPTVECLREMMDEKDLWPINKEVWDYLDGDGFTQMSTLGKALTDEYGESSSIDEYAQKAQFLGAMNYKSIWEVWNYNKLGYGDRWASGVLFWYHNNAIRHVGSMMWDWSLEPMASLFAAQNALEPLHAQFDYLKNTVSVVNDYYKAFKGYKVTATVYDLNGKVFSSKSATVDLPEDGVANDVITLEFPEKLTQVHFIKLRLFDENGKQVSDNFYWRSKDKYEGKTTLTGPCTSGFQSIKDMPKAKLGYKASFSRDGEKQVVTVTVRNRTGHVAFFNQIQLLDAAGKPVRPSFYTDNFFSLVPGEQKTVTIETALEDVHGPLKLKVRGWNTHTFEYAIP